MASNSSRQDKHHRALDVHTAHVVAGALITKTGMLEPGSVSGVGLFSNEISTFNEGSESPLATTN